jgi:hypothetical protein
VGKIKDTSEIKAELESFFGHLDLADVALNCCEAIPKA